MSCGLQVRGRRRTAACVRPRPIVDLSQAPETYLVTGTRMPSARQKKNKARQQPRKKLLPGGFVRGDSVVSTITQDDLLAIGDVGTVLGPTTLVGAEAEGMVQASFPNWPDVNICAMNQIVKKAAWDASLLQLPVGLRLGDEVVNTLDGDKLAIGDVGTVIGPVVEQNAAPQRIFVVFAKGTWHVKLTEMMPQAEWETYELPGGFVRGESVVSTIFHEGTLAIGDVGTVLGPPTSTGADTAERVLTMFPNWPKVNISRTQIVKKSVWDASLLRLPVGFQAGDTVVSTIRGDKLAIGDVGTVIGPAEFEQDAAPQRMFVAFSNGTRHVNMSLTEMMPQTEWETFKLPGGFKCGDSVVSTHGEKKNGKVLLTIGDVGTVLGQSTTAEFRAGRVLIAFPNWSRVNVLASDIVKKAAWDASLLRLPIGFQAGDTVLSTIRADGDKFAIGDVGTVIGPGKSEQDAAQRVFVAFPKGTWRVKLTDMMPQTVGTVELPGGFVRGDSVVSTITQDDLLTIGDVGTVLGPTTLVGAEAEGMVQASFPNWSRVNICAINQIVKKAAWDASLLQLPVGLRLGDTVVSTIRGDKLAIGDVGTVIGPVVEQNVAPQRMFVAFSNGTWHMKLAEMMPQAKWGSFKLPGGFVRGEYVVSKVGEEKDGKVLLTIGDVGTVLGRSTSDGPAAAGTQVLIAFPNWSRVNVMASDIMKKTDWDVSLPGSLLKESAVVSILASRGLRMGDTGTVISRSTSERVKSLQLSNEYLSRGVMVNFQKMPSAIDVILDTEAVSKADWDVGLPGGLRWVRTNARPPAASCKIAKFCNFAICGRLPLFHAAGST